MKPKITYLLISYNQQSYIQDAVYSAINQTEVPHEIIISDDFSTDSTFSIITKLLNKYNGPAKILVNQNKKNLGVVEHINSIMKCVTGEYVIAAAGDDISEPNRVEEISKIISNHKVSAVCSNAAILGEDDIYFADFNNFGNSVYPIENILKFGDTPAFGAAMCWEKSIYTVFGDVSNNVRNEDKVIPFRASLLNGLYILDKSLIRYRTHDHNLSFWVKMKNAEFLNWKKLRIAYLNNFFENYKCWIDDLNRVKEYKFNYISDVNSFIKQIDIHKNGIYCELLILRKVKHYPAKVLKHLFSMSIHPKRIIILVLMMLSQRSYYRYCMWKMR